jgi:CPA1 family monovalent cation:H+ antiporter
VPDVEFLIFLLLAVVVLAAIAQRSSIPQPIVLVLGGLVLGLVPGLPSPQVDPQVVLFVFLPPLLYMAAFSSSAYELRDNAVPIGLLAVPLVLVTVAAVAAVAHYAAGVGWAPAFVLGAVVGPTDPVAATTIIRRLGAPGRIGTILEGESLVNDGTALTAYKIALGAVGSAGITAWAIAPRFVAVAVGGIAAGLAAGWVFGRLRRAFDEPSIDVTLSVLTPFAAYVPAERIGASGVLAAVTAGLWVGHQSLGLAGPESRLRTRTFWDALTFLLNSVLFLLIGLQLPRIVDRIENAELPGLAGQGLLLAAVVMTVRMAWMFTVPDLVTLVTRRAHDGALRWTNHRERVVLGWSAMRGGVSLAAALAIPESTSAGPFPDRDLIIFLAYAVVLVTLVVPGLTLSRLVEVLGLSQGEERRRQDAELRLRLTQTALERLDDIARDEGAPDGVIDRLRDRYTGRADRLEARLGGGPRERGDAQQQAARVQQELLEAERSAVRELQRERAYPADLLERLQSEIDLDESRLRARMR